MTATEKTTQEERILDYIYRNGSLTRLEAVTELGIFELAARINGLEKKGFTFDKTPITFKTRSGATGHCKRYTLGGGS